MKITVLILLSLLTFPSAKAQKNEPSKSKPKVPDVALCDLIRNPDFYDGKEIRLRATFVSSPMHLVSAFHDKSCNDENNLTWVEFDEVSVRASSKPEVIRRLEKEVLFPEINFVTSETEMLVKGIFHRPNESGYGRENKYSFMVTIKSVEEVGATNCCFPPRQFER